MSKKSTNAMKIIVYVIIVALVASAIAVIFYFTNGFTTDFSTFFVEVNDEQILTSASGLVVSTEEPLEVNIKYVFTSKDVHGYSVQVVPNAIDDKDFDFTVDGEVYSYQAEEDLIGGFDIFYGKEFFTIKAKGGITQILQAVYPGRNVEDCTSSSYTDMFKIIVKSYDGKQSVELNFSVPEQATDVETNQSLIII